MKSSVHQGGVKFSHKYMALLFWTERHEGQTMFQPWLCCHILWCICCYEGKLLPSILLFLRKRIRLSRDLFELTLTSRTASLRKFSFGDSVRAWGKVVSRWCGSVRTLSADDVALYAHCQQVVWLCTHIVSRWRGSVRTFSAGGVDLYAQCQQVMWLCTHIVNRWCGSVRTLSAGDVALYAHCQQVVWLYAHCQQVVWLCTHIVSRWCGSVRTLSAGGVALYAHCQQVVWLCTHIVSRWCGSVRTLSAENKTGTLRINVILSRFA